MSTILRVRKMSDVSRKCKSESLSEKVQIEDPRLEWRALQEDMLRSYLVTAQEDLTAKKELVNIKQARLTLAQDEFHHLNTTMSALSNSTTSCKYLLRLSLYISLSVLIDSHYRGLHAQYNFVSPPSPVPSHHYLSQSSQSCKSSLCAECPHCPVLPLTTSF